MEQVSRAAFLLVRVILRLLAGGAAVTARRKART